MAGRTGRVRRPNGTGKDTTAVKARLTTRALEVAEKTAEALGVTRDVYLEHLLLQEETRLTARGIPDWWKGPVPADQEELPLSQSA